MKPFYKTKKYGNYLVTVSATESWNRIQKQLEDIQLKDLSPQKIKAIVSDFYLKVVIKNVLGSRNFGMRN